MEESICGWRKYTYMYMYVLYKYNTLPLKRLNYVRMLCAQWMKW